MTSRNILKVRLKELLPAVVALLFSMVLMPSVPGAFATLTTYIKDPPYDHGYTDWYSTTGAKYCNPPQFSPTYQAEECTFVYTSNGIMDLSADAWLKVADPLFKVQTWAQGKFGTQGDPPTTICLNNGYFKFRDTHGYEGDAYRTSSSNADGYLTHYFRIFRSPSCNGTWDTAVYASFQGQILRAGTPGTVTHFSGTPLVYTGVYGGQTGMFSVRLENTANAIAVNYSGERGYADFYDGGTNYGTQIQRIKSFSCTTLTECQNAS